MKVLSSLLLPQGQGWCQPTRASFPAGSCLSRTCANLGIPSVLIASNLLLPSSWTTDRSPSISDLHWHLAKSGAKQTLLPMTAVNSLGIHGGPRVVSKFPNKIIENLFRLVLYHMLLPGFQETPAALILTLQLDPCRCHPEKATPRKVRRLTPQGGRSG